MQNVPIEPVSNAAETAPTRFFSILIIACWSIFSFLAATDIFIGF